MNPTIPKIEIWIEGVLDYFDLNCPSEIHDSLRFGFFVGKQVIGLYVLEVLLKYTREKRRRPYRQDHNLRKLFQGLAPRDQKKIEKKYQDILHSTTATALDIERSVSALLTYLGHKPITSTRYFWESSHPDTAGMSILIAPHMLGRIIYAILIPLHRYPEKPGSRRRFATSFAPRNKWVEKKKADRMDSPKKPSKEWLVGLRIYFGQLFPRADDDPRKLGFGVGCQIVGLYLGEMLLKYALDERAVDYKEDHNLEEFFQRLPPDDQERIRTRYVQILHSEPGHAWDFQETIDDLLRYLQRDPFTESRYFWDAQTAPRGGVLFSPRILTPMIDAFFAELHGFFFREGVPRFFEREFESFEESIRKMEEGADHTEVKSQGGR